jgi:hypothetical protein
MECILAAFNKDEERMREAKVEDEIIVTGPDSPNVAQCPICGGEVHKRSRRRMDGCVCPVCGKERHEWKYIVDPDAVTGPVANFMDEMSTYRQRCTRCGQWKGRSGNGSKL